MQICKLIDGKPTDIQPIPQSIPGVSNPMLSDMISRGWLIHAPSATPHIKESHWERQGDACVQVVNAVYSRDDLGAQATKAAEDEAAQQAAEAESAAAFKAFQGELENAQLITKGLALTILEELNRITHRMRDFDAAVQAASTLPDLKTRVNALLPIPDRTVAQLRAAVKAKVGTL